MKNAEKTSENLTLAILGAMALVGAGIFILTSPTSTLLLQTSYSVRGAFHGLAATLFMITATVGVFQAFHLWSGSALNIRELEIGATLNAVACFFAVLLGNWVYIPYRAPGGPRSDFMQKYPVVQTVFFEFKEHLALFTLPLAVTAAYLIVRYREKLLARKELRDMTAVLLVLAFFYFLVAFGLGAAITKLRPV